MKLTKLGLFTSAILGCVFILGCKKDERETENTLTTAHAPQGGFKTTNKIVPKLPPPGAPVNNPGG
jgi:hypothetical protein